MPGNCFEVINIDAMAGGTKAMIEISETEFDTKCKWIDSKTVQYNGKRYKVIEYRAGNMKLVEI